MFELTRLADYAVVLVIDMGRCYKNLSNASDITRRTGIPLPTTRKILRRLAAHSLVVSTRGKYGGYRLSRSPSHLRLADVLMAMEGPVALTACVDGVHGHCIAEGFCQVRGRWDIVNRAIREALNATTIADMIGASVESSTFAVSAGNSVGVKHAG